MRTVGLLSRGELMQLARSLSSVSEQQSHLEGGPGGCGSGGCGGGDGAGGLDGRGGGGRGLHGRRHGLACCRVWMVATQRGIRSGGERRVWIKLALSPLLHACMPPLGRVQGMRAQVHW